jgi:predicted nicotinamide N-methyase
VPPSTRTSLTPFLAAHAGEVDGLRLVHPTLIPEIGLHLADDAIVLRARMEVQLGADSAPFWASAWAGGQALARYILDHPQVVAGRRVLDVASGCGVAAIAAAKAGAAAVTANDIDPYALLAVTMNAEANGVAVGTTADELLDGDGRVAADLILIGDAFYTPGLAVRMQRFLRRAANNTQILVGDPDRGHLPDRWLEVLASYRVSGLGAAEDARVREVLVLGPAPRSVSTRR